METSGFFSEKIDNWLGMNYQMLDKMPIRK
jgi:hypothetical protein